MIEKYYSHDGMTSEEFAEVRAHREQVTQNITDYLYQIRMGNTPEIVHEFDGDEDEFVLVCEGMGFSCPLDGNTYVVNKLIGALVHHYRELCALLGDPCSHQNRERLANFPFMEAIDFCQRRQIAALREASNPTP